jgi:predicted kinase
MGVPGAGKSYVASYLHRTGGYSVVSGESVTFALFQSDECTAEQYATAHAVARALTREQLTAGYDVVFDSSKVRRVFRQQLYDEEAGIGCRVAGIFLRISEDRALARLARRGVDQSDVREVQSICSPETFQRFFHNLEVPGSTEPFVEVDADADDGHQRIEAVLNAGVPPAG